MATVTGMTAAAMIAIQNDMIVDADFDSAGHLILTKHDGTQIDGGTIPGATTGVPGLVELATTTEAAAGTDTVRGVTPAGLSSFIVPYNTRINTLETTKIQLVTGKLESDTSAAYSQGTSLQVLSTGSGWSLNNGFGSVMTVKSHADRTAQYFFASTGGTNAARVWFRHYSSSDGGGGWTAWVELRTIATLNAASFTQTTAATSYPSGESRLYYTSATGGSWDFSGIAGEVVTFRDTANSYTKQTFTEHAGGSGGTPLQWYRTATTAGGWTPWMAIVTGSGAWTPYTPTWTATTTNPVVGANGTLTGRWTKVNRKMTVEVNLTVGSSTTLGSGNYSFSIPQQAASGGLIAIGNAQLLDNKRWLGQVVVSPGATTMSPFFPISATTTEANFQTNAVPEAMDVGASLRMFVEYETAT